MKEKRFDVILSETNGLINHYQIIVDKITGINYLFVRSGYGAGLTPLLDEKGKPVIKK